ETSLDKIAMFNDRRDAVPGHEGSQPLAEIIEEQRGGDHQRARLYAPANVASKSRSPVTTATWTATPILRPASCTSCSTAARPGLSASMKYRNGGGSRYQLVQEPENSSTLRFRPST